MYCVKAESTDSPNRSSLINKEMSDLRQVQVQKQSRPSNIKGSVISSKPLTPSLCRPCTGFIPKRCPCSGKVPAKAIRTLGLLLIPVMRRREDSSEPGIKAFPLLGLSVDPSLHSPRGKQPKLTLSNLRIKKYFLKDINLSHRTCAKLGGQ